MDDLSFVWSAPALWALLGLGAVVVWHRHRQHAYLLCLAAAWLCAGAASAVGAGAMGMPSGAVPGLAVLLAGAAAVLTAQATAQRFGRSVHVPSVVLIGGLMLLAWACFAYLQPSVPAQQAVLSLGMAALLAHVVLAIGPVALRHSMERNLLLVYCVVCVSIACIPWLHLEAMPGEPMLWLLLGAVVFSGAMVACVWAESPRHLRAAHDRDELTGLLSRPAFDKACGARPAEQHIRFMVLCDLDHFQRVNQQFGPSVGDEVLRQFAHLLQASVRTGDVVARLGGEEFALALRHIDPAHAHALVQRVVDAMAQQHGFSKLSAGPLTASFGVAMVREEDSVDIALHRADVLLCQAKDAGCNQIAMEEMLAEPELRFQ